MKIHPLVIFLSSVLTSFDIAFAQPAGKPNADFYFNVATNQFARKDWGQTIQAFTKYIQLNPTNALAYAIRGDSYFARGDFDNAICDFTRQIQIDPTNATAYQNRGTAYRAKNGFSQAIADYSKSLQLDPKNVEALAGRATAHRHLNEFEESIHDLDQVMSINPCDARIFVMRGMVFSDQRQFQKAVNDFQRASQLDPNNYDAIDDLAWLRATCPLAEMRNGKEAIAMATRVCVLTDWRRWEYLDTLATAYAEARDFTNAIKYEKQALNTNATGKTNSDTIQSRLSLFEHQQRFREKTEQ